MALKTGIAAQFGMKAEGTYGTAVTVDRFLEFNSESIATQFQTIYSRGLGSGRFQKTTHVVRNVIGAAGPVEFDVMDKGFGLLLKHCIGGVTSAQQGGTAEYRHRVAPDSAGMQGVAATVQIGRPDVAGTVQPFTFEGGKVTEWELKFAYGEPVKLSTTWDFETLATGTALASASYTSGRTPYVYSDTSALTIAGSTVFARSVSIKGTNGLDLERRGVTSVLKKEPVASDLMAITGELDCEFESLTHYTSIASGTQQAFSLTLTGDTIPTTANPHKIVIDIAKIHFMDAPPAVEGPGIVRQKLAFEGLYDGSNSLIQIDYHSDDTSA